MIIRKKITDQRKHEVISKEKKHKPFKDHVFYGKEQQGGSVYIASKPGSGKTRFCFELIKRLCDKNESQIFWISDITGLDQTLMKDLEDYHVQYFSLQDVKNHCIRQLFDYLKDQRMSDETYYPYIKWFVVFDDIILNN